MVFHVGIDFSNGDVAVYNAKTKQTIKFKILNEYDEETVFSFLDYNNKRLNKSRIYENIKAKLKGDFGYACVFMNDNCQFDIRQEFVKKGKEYGFKKILIINSITKNCLDYLLNLKEKLKVGDIFWIFDNSCCGIWEKTDTKAQLIKIFDHKYDSITTKYLSKVKEDSGVDKNPNMIILDIEFYGKLFKTIKTVFPDCQCILHRRSLQVCDISLIKARILADDQDLNSDIKICNVDNYLYDKAKIWGGAPPYGNSGKIFLNLNRGERVPLQKSLIIPIKTDVKFTEITCWIGNLWTTEKIKIIPEMLGYGKILIILKIDENCIPFFEFPENKEQRITNLYANNIKSEPTYNIPHKVLINNLNINAIGIDLGMTRCCVAVRRKDRFELVAIDNSERQLPSYISFKESKPICGKLAFNQLHLYANSTVFDMKRIIGRNLDDIEINSIWPFEVTKSDNNEKSMIRVQGYDGNIVEKRPEEVSAILLKHIKQKIEEFQGRKLDEVVITIPVAFNVDQKIATHVGADLAGFKTVHLLEEPIAASIAYFVDRPIPSNFNLLLFDLGGGTLDLCIFKVEKNNLKIIAIDGDSHLGGRDFDVILYMHFAKILETQYEIIINERNKYRLMQKSVEIKHAISKEQEASLDVSDFDPKIDEFLTVTRQEFEKMAEPILDRIQEILKQTFSKTNIYASDINKVLLVGGGCRMPMVKSLIHDTFTKAEHFCDKNPDEMVAIGAAYYSSFIMSKNDSTACNIM